MHYHGPASTASVACPLSSHFSRCKDRIRRSEVTLCFHKTRATNRTVCLVVCGVILRSNQVWASIPGRKVRGDLHTTVGWEVAPRPLSTQGGVYILRHQLLEGCKSPGWGDTPGNGGRDTAFLTWLHTSSSHESRQNTMCQGIMSFLSK